MKLIESPINYMGSKFKLLNKLIPLFPKDKSTFVDLFTGGGSVYMNVAHLYEKVVANDILNSLVEIHKHLQNDGFINRAANLSISTKDSQEEFLRLRHYYNSFGNPDSLLALIWSCNSNMMRFNNKFEFNQTWGKRCFNKNTQKKIDTLKEKDFSNVTFTTGCFSNLSTMPCNDSFVYLDPPYSNTEAGYNAFWNDTYENNLIVLIQSFIDNGVAFGISGVLNGKENRVYHYLKDKDLQCHYFGDMYQKISKSEKVNVEYYITNVKNVSLRDTLF